MTAPSRRLSHLFPLVFLSLAALLGAGCLQNRSSPVVAPDWVPALVAISVPDVDAAVAWYGDKLGFRVERRSDFPDLGLRIAWVVRGGARLELIQQRGSTSRSEVSPDPANPALVQGFGKIGIRVADPDLLAEELRGKGVRFQLQLRDDPTTHSRAFIVLDNNGNWLQFYAPLP